MRCCLASFPVPGLKFTAVVSKEINPFIEEFPMKTVAKTLFLYVFSAAYPVQAPTLPAIDSDAEHFRIYSLVLTEYFAKAKVQHIVVGEQTLMEFPPIMMGMTQFGDTMSEIRETAAKETLEDYTEKNRTPVILRGTFATIAPVVLISASERDTIFEIKGDGKKKTANPEGMKELQRLYPGCPGLTNLSRIGFNKSRDQALVYVGNICGGLCGSGQFFFLIKERGSWKIKLSATTWVS
jgi:hypothetical protein